MSLHDDVRSIYTGWGNPRSVYKVRDVVVMVDEKGNSSVGPDEVVQELSDLTHHLCGVRKSASAEKLLHDTQDHRHHRHAYNAIFDKYWSN